MISIGALPERAISAFKFGEGTESSQVFNAVANAAVVKVSSGRARS
jgi:hypothetical protein